MAARADRSIVLVGLMGTGKSTVARRLGARLELDVVDTDREIEAAEGRHVRQIFAESGEETFRDMESDALSAALARTACVVAAAGGAVLRPANRELLARASAEGRAVVVWLRAGTDALEVRTSRGGHRPLLDGDRAGTLARLAEERNEMYAEVADVVVDTDDREIDDVVDAVMTAVGRAESS